MNQVTVIRIVQYEGTEEAVRSAIQKSMTLGVRQCAGYTITIAEHLNELPELIELLDVQVENDLKRASKFSAEFHGVSENSGPFLDALIEEKAVEIYNSWKELDGWVPWVTCGNSTMQGNARREARIALKL